MNPFRWLEQKAFLGEIIKDYGFIEDRREGISRTKTRVFLSRRRGKVCFVIKHSSWAFLGGATSYFYIEPDHFETLREILDDMHKLPR